MDASTSPWPYAQPRHLSDDSTDLCSLLLLKRRLLRLRGEIESSSIDLHRDLKNATCAVMTIDG
jgi:hypothetical protein